MLVRGQREHKSCPRTMLALGHYLDNACPQTTLFGGHSSPADGRRTTYVRGLRTADLRVICARKASDTRRLMLVQGHGTQVPETINHEHTHRDHSPEPRTEQIRALAGPLALHGTRKRCAGKEPEGEETQSTIDFTRWPRVEPRSTPHKPPLLALPGAQSGASRGRPQRGKCQ